MSAAILPCAAGVLTDRSIRFVPRFFVPEFDDGRPRLSEEGQKAIQEELERGKRVEQL